MAMVDYGVLVLKNGVPQNKNGELFVEEPAYMKAPIAGNYFCYCGDEKFSLCFYKTCMIVARNGEDTKDHYWNFPFASETIFLPETKVTVKRLDPLRPVYATHSFGCNTWKEYVKENWCGATGDEKLSELWEGGKAYKRWRKWCKRIGRKKVLYYESTQKYSATWEYGGDQWEVIFGYGIENDEEVFNHITSKGQYNYGENSEKYIREKFFGVKRCKL